jgi:tRNA (cmo5U34)-methyltransferase
MQKDWQVWQKTSVAAMFANRRRGGVLGSTEQMETLLRLLNDTPTLPGRVLDLGCGDGILLETILTAYPECSGIGLDGSPIMLQQAQTRLGAMPSVTLIEADFNQPDWQEKIPAGEYAAIVSGFAIHHSEDETKQRLYNDIFARLAPGGVFVNIEHVASSTPRGERLFDRAWCENVVRFKKEKGERVTFEEVLEEHDGREDREANRLTPVETQLAWLREIGFTDVDCYWKHYELAVLAGYKP